MAKKKKTVFVCTECGEDYLKWVGQCNNCGAWDTVKELRQYKATSTTRGSLNTTSPTAKPIKLSDFEAKEVSRATTGLGEVDRVLGGGVVPGSMILVGGAPGIGKSTLMLHVAGNMDSAGKNILYISGEESPEQLAIRSKRLGLDKCDIVILTETSIDIISNTVSELKPDVVILDSIQTVFSPDIDGAPGSVSQIRECTSILMRQTKESEAAFFIIGHVTKDGAIAGPRILEHMVDTVLYFEGDSNLEYRILRAIKNRFGPSDEIALLSMESDGLKELKNASSFFLTQRESGQTGCSVVPIREGSRILVMELQSLVNSTHFGMPQRVASGINQKKLSLIIAVLEKFANIELGDFDIFINITGGLKVSEPALDLALAAALLSSFQNRSIKVDTAFIGEIGLGGEIREVSSMESRINELASLGFSECIVPRPKSASRWSQTAKGIKLTACNNVSNLEHLIY